jgi:hypothetical protein
MSDTPPRQNDYVDEVWLQVIDLYIDDERTSEPIKDLLKLCKKLVKDPDNAREILDQEYLVRRNAYDASQSR